MTNSDIGLHLVRLEMNIDLNEVARNMIGTQRSLGHLLKDMGVEAAEVDLTFHEDLEEKAQCCLGCGFWFAPEDGTITRTAFICTDCEGES